MMAIFAFSFKRLSLLSSLTLYAHITHTKINQIYDPHTHTPHSQNQNISSLLLTHRAHFLHIFPPILIFINYTPQLLLHKSNHPLTLFPLVLDIAREDNRWMVNQWP